MNWKKSGSGKRYTPIVIMENMNLFLKKSRKHVKRVVGPDKK